MKNLLFALLVIIITANSAGAQSTVAPARGNEERLAMVSKTNELEAALTRNQPQLTQTVVPEVLTMMKNHFARNTSDVQKLKGDEQKAMTEKIKKETVLIADYQKLSTDPAKNKKELISTARAFIMAY